MSFVLSAKILLFLRMTKVKGLRLKSWFKLSMSRITSKCYTILWVDRCIVLQYLPQSGIDKTLTGKLFFGIWRIGQNISLLPLLRAQSCLLRRHLLFDFFLCLSLLVVGMSLRPSLMWMQPQLPSLDGRSWAARDTEHGLTSYARVYTRSFVFFSVTSVTGLSRKLSFLFDYVRTFREIKGRFQKIKGHFRENVGHFRENMGLLGGYESNLFWGSWFLEKERLRW